MYLVEKKIPYVPLIGGIVISLFGGLTLYFDNPIFLYMKPTIVNIIFAAILITSKIFFDKNFLKLKVDPTLSANKIIGVKEIREYLEKKIDLNQVIELINIKTRQYAKRQVTWSRGHMVDWKREYSNSFSELSKNILKLLS